MAASEFTLCALPYHEALAGYLQREEPETWKWFGSAESQATHAESLRMELLKHTYRLEATAYPELFAALTDAKLKLGLEAPVTLYQAQTGGELNASLMFIPGEVHIVFHGNVLPLLGPAELRGLLGHELAHYVLWSGVDRKFLLTDRISQAMALDPRGEASHVECARLLRLYTEIYADRGALQVTGDPAPVISCLIKIYTGLAQVDTDSYVRQADEIFSRAKIKTDGLTHPEAFIRARAVMLWAEKTDGVDAEVTRMIEGEPLLDRLDLLGQQRVTAWTRRWLQLYLRAPWFRTDAIRGHARLFFPDFEFAQENHTDEPLLAELKEAGLGVRDYFLYLLLDFSAVDPDLELEPVRAAFRLAGELKWDARLEVLVVKELKLKKREAQELRAELKAAPTEAEPAAGAPEVGAPENGASEA